MIMLTLISQPQTGYQELMEGLKQFLRDNMLNAIAIVRGGKKKDHLHAFISAALPMDTHSLKGIAKISMVPDEAVDEAIGFYTANHECVSIN